MSNQKKRAKGIRYFAVGLAVVAAAFWGLRLAWLSQYEKSLISVVFNTTDGNNPRFKLEVVNTPSGRARGLMYRREMDLDRGMLFIFPDIADHGFYMKNTYLSLDILFVSEDFKIVGILENMPILNEQSRAVNKASKYVIELNAGAVKNNGIKVGDSLVFNNPLPAAS